MYQIPDSRDARAVENRVCAIFGSLYAGASTDFIRGIFAEISAMFEGRSYDFQPNNLGYHDYTHTLQATDCLAQMLHGYVSSQPEEPLAARHFELGIASMMFHDTGYLCSRSDDVGTGAKYTYTHVLRSCAVAASLLPRHGVTLGEIDGLLGAIRCTGPTADITRLHFSGRTQRLLGCAVSTADYLAQMAAPDYPDELGVLFHEFEESDDYLNVPREKRVFKSVEDLIAKTPMFWSKVVEPKLNQDFDQMYLYLATPYPDGPNPYLLAIEKNLERIKAMADAPSPITT